MKLSLNLVTWNGAKYIPFLFDSLRKQTFQDFRLVILDNGSTDGTVEAIMREFGKWKIREREEWVIHKNEDNIGFARGHNKLFSNFPISPIPNYILLLNQDIYLEPDCLEKLVSFMDRNPSAAAAAPRLMRWDFENKKFTNQIDAIGLKVFRNRRVIENFSGQNWPLKEASFNVGAGGAARTFGLSGAIMMFRRDKLEKYMLKEELFDESHGSYKEDVDLAFRLQSAGLRSYVALDAVAYHERTSVGPDKMTDFAAARNKRNHPDYLKYSSYKNHLVTLYKNEYWQNFILDFPWILWYELKKFAWYALFDRRVLKAIGEIWKNRYELKLKRAELKEKRKISWKQIRKYWR